MESALRFDIFPASLQVAGQFYLEFAQRRIFRRDIFSGVLRVADHFLLESAQRAILRRNTPGAKVARKPPALYLSKALFAF